MINDLINLADSLDKTGALKAAGHVDSMLIKLSGPKTKMIGIVTTNFPHQTLGTIMVGINIEATWTTDLLKKLKDLAEKVMTDQPDLKWDRQNLRQKGSLLNHASYVIGQKIAESGILNQVILPAKKEKKVVLIIEYDNGAISYKDDDELIKTFNNGAPSDSYPGEAQKIMPSIQATINSLALGDGLKIYIAVYNYLD